MKRILGLVAPANREAKVDLFNLGKFFLFFFVEKTVKVKVVFYGQFLFGFIPKGIYLFKFNDRNTRKMCEIYPKLSNKDTGVNGVVLVLLLSTMNIFHTFF